jgi:predicted Zn-dependent protease
VDGTSRIDALLKMAQARPDDPRARFGLALEYERAGHFEDVVTQLRAYLSLADDQGNAYGRLARALRHLGRDQEALAAYRDGIAAASKHGHPTMVEEFEEEIVNFEL